jgi:hypothetical protein
MLATKGDISLLEHAVLKYTVDDGTNATKRGHPARRNNFI